MNKRKRRLTKWIVRLVILALLGCGVYWIGLPMLKASVTTTYDTYTASIGSISNDLSFSGSFALKNSETLTAPVSATVRGVFVKAGDKVSANSRIARLSNGETLKASMDGTVNTIDVSEGDEITAGQQICQIADFNTLSVSIRVDEYDIGEVRVGDTCTVTATSQEKSYEAQIAKINYVSQSTGNVAYYTATADVEVGSDIYPGMQATITIPKDSVENVVILKMDALSFDRENKAYVYMKDENDALKQVEVTVGMDNGSFVEITSGLSEGDVVYVEAEQEEQQSGLMSLFGGLQQNQFNPERGNRGNGGNFGGGSGGSMPSFPGGGLPGGNAPSGGMPGMPGGN